MQTVHTHTHPTAAMFYNILHIHVCRHSVTVVASMRYPLHRRQVMWAFMSQSLIFLVNIFGFYKRKPVLITEILPFVSSKVEAKRKSSYSTRSQEGQHHVDGGCHPQGRSDPRGLCGRLLSGKGTAVSPLPGDWGPPAKHLVGSSLQMLPFP